MINVKTDSTLKNEAQKLAKQFGLSLSTVINYFLKEFVAERKITFAEHPYPNKKTQAILDRALKDIKSGKNLVGPFTNADDLMKSLLS